MSSSPSNSFSSQDFLDFSRCPKLAWLRKKKPDVFPEPERFLFDQRRDIENLALSLFPGGVERPELVLDRPFENDFFADNGPLEGKAFSSTPWYRPKLRYQNCVAEPLCLVPRESPEGIQFDIYDTTLSRDLRDKDMDALSFCAWVFANAGIPIGKIVLLTLERDYIHRIPTSAVQVFRTRELTRRFHRFLPRIAEKIETLPQLHEETEEPFAETGPRCFVPTACPLLTRCHPSVPEASVFQLHKGRKTAQELIQAGYETLEEIPENWPLTPSQKIQVEAVKGGRTFTNPPAIRMFLDAIEFPLHFLDFETYQTALPLHPGTRPYQMIPFQFSLHIMDTPDAEPRHESYLAEAGVDPRKEILSRLKQHIGPKGSVAAFNAGFETARLREMGESFSEFREWVVSLTPRFVDFWDPFRFFHYYHPEQRGKTGIKTLLPILSAGPEVRSYDELDVADGHDASLFYMETHLRETDLSERNVLREKLLRYCEMDTWAMIEIYRRLRGLVLAKA